MVPREPTEEMVLNGVKAFQHSHSETNVLEDWKDCYRAMIAMAPPIHKREWVGLTGADFEKEKFVNNSFLAGASFAAAKLKEKNGG